MKRNLLLTLLAIVVLACVFGLAWKYSPCYHKTVILLPNQGQFQQLLNAIEPNNPIKVDYVIGSDSREKWDRICGNEYASVFYTPSGAPRKE